MNDDWAELGGAWRAVELDTPPDLSIRILEGRSRKFARRIAWRNAREWLASVVVAGIAIDKLVHARQRLEWLPGIALLCAVAWMSVHLFRHGRNLALPTPTATTSDFIANERAALERQRALLSSVRRWYIAPFLLAMLVDLTVRIALGTLSWQRLALALLVFGGVGFVLDRLNARAARGLAARIGELDG